MIGIKRLRFRSAQPRVAQPSPFEKIDLATQSWHIGAASGRGSPLHSLGGTSMAFQCSTCGKTHDGLPDVAFRWPDPYFAVPETERKARVSGDTDSCVIDGDAFYIRGVILIPIKETSDHFGLGVWVSQKRENFITYMENYDTADIGPFFGWLSNSISFYEVDTWAIKTMAHFQGKNQRPLIEPESSDHPLYIDYSRGISLERAWDIAHGKR